MVKDGGKIRATTVHDKSAVKKITPNGNRTRAACLEGKHDNHFTIGVVLEICHNILYNEDTCLSETSGPFVRFG